MVAVAAVPGGKFGARPLLRWISRWRVELHEDLVFSDPVHGLITVPAGFVSDLASIRMLRTICLWGLAVAALGKACLLVFSGLAFALTWLSSACWMVALIALALYAMVVGYGAHASILHDWLYTIGWLSRLQCDAVYYRALHTGDGTARWRSSIFWTGVRIGGARHYMRTPPSAGFSSPRI